MTFNYLYDGFLGVRHVRSEGDANRQSGKRNCRSGIRTSFMIEVDVTSVERCRRTRFSGFIVSQRARCFVTDMLLGSGSIVCF